MALWFIAFAFWSCDREHCPDCGDPTEGGNADGQGPYTTEPVRTDVVTTGPCAVTDDLEVTSVVAEAGPTAIEAEITLSLSEPATAAALCTSDEDAGEQILVESLVSSQSHRMRVQGLRPGEGYTCQVAPTCPTMAAYPRAIPLTAGSAPQSVPTLDVTVDPELGMTGYWTLLPFEGGGGCGGTSYLVLYDADGAPRWWHRLPKGLFVDVEALYDPDEGVVVWGGGGGREGAARILDPWEGDRYVTPSHKGSVFHHDAKRLADGRLLTLQETTDTFGPYSWTGFMVRAHDPATGEISLEIASQRYVDEGWLRIAGLFWDTNPYHANWVDLFSDPVDGDVVYASLCLDRSIMAFDATTGDVRWKLTEDDGWTFLDPTGAPGPVDAFPQCQHGLEVLDRDVLLVYDNGWDREFSQITQLRVDAVERTVTVEWQWTEPDWWEATLGDVDDLGNGRVLVTQAHPECWSGRPGDRSAIVEVDRATGRVASRLEFPDPNHVTYRAERYAGCEIFANLRACPELASRTEELRALVGW